MPGNSRFADPQPHGPPAASQTPSHVQLDPAPISVEDSSRAISRSVIVLDAAIARSDIPGRSGSQATLFVPNVRDEERAWWRAAGCDVITSGDLITHEVTAEAKQASEDIMRAVWQVPVDGRPLGEQFVYRGIPMGEVARSHLVTVLVEALVRVAALDEWLKRNPVREVWVPRKLGDWSRAAAALAGARQITIRRLRRVPRPVPLWPPTRRSLTQWVPDVFRRWRDRRDAEADVRRLMRQNVHATPRRDESCDVLIMAHYVSEGRAVLPVLQRLAGRGGLSVRLVTDWWGRAAQDFDAAKVPYSLLHSVSGMEDAARRVASSLPALSRLWRRFLWGSAGASVSFRGVSVPWLMRDVWRVLSDTSRRHDTLHMYLWWAELIIRAYERYSPRVILLADELMPINVIRLEAAAQKRIPTLSIQHGALTDHPKCVAGRATRILVGGDALRQFLIGRGTDPGRIVVVGIPQFDAIADGDAIARVPVRERLRIPSHERLVVYTMLSGTGVTPRDDVIGATREVLAAAERLRDACAFVFKRHPADRADILSQMEADRRRWGIAVTMDAPLHPLLWNADVVITQMSTTGQEAIMLGKPLIVVNVTGKPDTIPYVAYGAALGVYQVGELVDAIRRALTDEATRAALAEGRRRFIADFAYRVDGKATDRIVAEIDRLLNAGEGRAERDAASSLDS